MDYIQDDDKDENECLFTCKAHCSILTLSSDRMAINVPMATNEQLYRVHSLLQGQHLLRASVKTIGIRYLNKKKHVSPFKEY